MKDYQHFSVNDFVMDDYFQSWVLKPDDENRSFWMTWLSKHPEKAKEVEEARHVLQCVSFSSYTLSGEDVSGLWSRIVGLDKNKTTRTNTPMSRHAAWYGIAASFLVATLAFVFLWNRSQTQEYCTAYGETQTIILPDSSSVILNSNSVLKLSSHWDDTGPREVWLDGEAYFSVTHTKRNQPFRVITGEGVAVEVLGTTFNVYHRVAQTKVVLNSGQVRLSVDKAAKQEKITMEPGEMVEIDEERFIKKHVDTRVYTAWTENKLILNHTSLREMTRMLKDNYGIEITVRPSKLLDQTVSGSMPLGDPERLLDQIGKAFRLRIIKQENAIIMEE